jgi:uncharacterized membrane protein YdjX (TVP38/TMEM64 family)
MKIPRIQGHHIVEAMGGFFFLLFSAALFLLLRGRLFSSFTTENIERFLSTFGIFAPLLYIVLLAVAIVISQIPNIPLAVASGMVFGPFMGGVYSLAGGMLGALACFWIARSLGVTIVRRIFGRAFYFCDRCNETYIWLIIFLSRLLPFFSFDLMSYGAGLANIRTKTFLSATFLGMIPMTFVFTYLGKSVVVSPRLTLILTLLLIALFVSTPLLFKRFNILGLRERIIFR